jgi:diguanylate cyclase (GGDEF)-like protein
VAAVLSAVAVYGGAAARVLVGPAAVAAVAWLGARAVGASAMAAKTQGEELLRLAQRDPLTGLLNRRSLYELVQRLAAQGKEFAIVLVDLDGFKRVNDKHGHLVGDRVLQRVAEAMEKAVRREDAVARYGGDEFAVLVQGGRETGEQVLERLKEAVESVAREAGVATSLSGGVAAWPEDGATLEELLHAADRMLYRAKRDGKGRLREARARVCSS